MKETSRPGLRHVFLSFCALILVGIAPADAASERPCGPLDAREAAYFFDAFFARRMRESKITGLVFALVSHGEILLLKGYGHADINGRVPVYPETTLFPVGSITKLITATAAMQLVEKGQLDLHRDINDYLGSWQIPATFPEPITLAHLLTHTSGFDDQNIGSYVHTPQEALPLAERVVQRLPWRLRPPGRLAAYSNYNYDLAGYLVERVSGVSFDQYVREHLFLPLDMDATGLGQVQTTTGFWAQGFIQRHSGLQLAPPTFDDTPSSGLVTTGRDMAHFLLAHLQRGRFNGYRILQEPTIQRMQARQFAPHPRLPGVAFGTSEYLRNGQRALAQGGISPGFVSLLFLLPAREVGFFVSYNNCHPLQHLNADLMAAFMDHYYPAVPTSANASDPGDSQRMRGLSLAAESSTRLAGTYRILRHSRVTPEIVATLLVGQKLVQVADGRLLIGEEEWCQQSPLFFTRGRQCAAFEEDEHGTITYLHLPDGTYERIPWYETMLWNVGAGLFCTLIFGVTCLAGMLGELSRLVLRRRQPSRLLGGLRRVVLAMAALNLIFLVGLYQVLQASDLYDFLYGMPLTLQGLLVLPLISAALNLSLLFLLPMAWRKGLGSRRSRVGYAVITAVGFGFLALLYNLNLLGCFS